MNFPRRQFLHLAAGAAALPAVSRIARAEAYPMRPITMIVSVAPGGSTDVIGPVVAERMREVLGQPVIIENVSGADASIGAGRAARAKPDGYTIDLGFLGNHVLNGALYSLPYDVLNDFALAARHDAVCSLCVCQVDPCKTKRKHGCGRAIDRHAV